MSCPRCKCPDCVLPTPEIGPVIDEIRGTREPAPLKNMNDALADYRAHRLSEDLIDIGDGRLGILGAVDDIPGRASGKARELVLHFVVVEPKR